MTINELPQHHGHEYGGAWWGCKACNPTTKVAIPITNIRTAQSVVVQDAKVYALLDAAEDFKTYFEGSNVTVEFVVDWLEQRANALEEDND